MKKNTKPITFDRAAAELCVSDSTILRLVQRGILHTTKPELKKGHWSRRILVDNAFLTERARRQHGLKTPRRKHIPDTDSVEREFESKAREKRMNGILEHWSNKCQESEDKCRNAMNICLEAQKACEVDKGAVDQCHNSVVDCAQAVTKCAGLANVCIDCRNTAMKSELTLARCTAILAAACILQLLLAAYYTLCHYNVL